MLIFDDTGKSLDIVATGSRPCHVVTIVGLALERQRRRSQEERIDLTQLADRADSPEQNA